MDNEPTASDHIAQRVRELRNARQMTVADLAARCEAEGMPKLTAQTLYKMEGQRNATDRPPRPVTVDELLVLARALEVAPVDLCPEVATTDPIPGYLLDQTKDMPVDAALSYIRGALRLLERWQAGAFEGDQSKADIFRDPARSPFALGRKQNDDGTWDVS